MVAVHTMRIRVIIYSLLTSERPIKSGPFLYRNKCSVITQRGMRYLPVRNG